MSLAEPVSLGDVHSELSCLLHAATEEFRDLGCAVKITYNAHTYLNLEVEVWGHDKAGKVQAVCDRLNHGILWGGYDYRFSMVARPCLDSVEGYNPPIVTAIVDTCNSKRNPNAWRWDHPSHAA